MEVLKHKGGHILTRDDFDGGPVSVDLIEDNLYLGNVTAASDVNTLTTLKITHILTIDSLPLPRHITEMINITTKYIQLSDMPKEDILSNFDVTNEFINTALTNGGVVLVHCYYGISRSASVVIAFVMNKYRLGYEEAYARVKSKRRLTHPNSGFVTQLKLFESMGSKMDKNHYKYRAFRLKIAAESVRKAKILPQSYMDLIKPDPGLTRARPEPLVYRCRKCRRIVASQSNIVLHGPKNKTKITSTDKISNEENIQDDIETEQDSVQKGINENIDAIQVLKVSEESIAPSEMSRKNSENEYDVAVVSGKIDKKKCDIDVCSKTYFVEPMAWMKDITQTSQGKLHCPNCKNKLGSFSWLMGCKCHCGIKVSPAFYLVPSKVEWSNVVQNVQVTV